MRACHPWLKRRGGSIVNFASGAGLDGQANPVSPIAHTSGAENRSKTHHEQYEQMLTTIPIGRMGIPSTTSPRSWCSSPVTAAGT